jgi:O-acetyl-ADP-ribose deacetylase (regulator of RNase III)
MILRTVKHQNLNVVVRVVPCILHTPPPPTTTATANILVVPANEQLSGTKLPYFPHPEYSATQSKSLHSNTTTVDFPPGAWGGGVVLGSNSFYPVQCIDGLLSLDAPAVRTITNRIPQNDQGVRVNIGDSVITSCQETSQLLAHYDAICHTVPPLWSGSGNKKNKENQHELLQNAYASALEASFNCFGVAACVSMPLLGCGARGAPPETSMNSAVRAILHYTGTGGTLDFAIQNPVHADIFVSKLDECLPD